MNITREEKKVEALERMKKFGYWGPAREAFRRQDKVFVNEPPSGAVYDLNEREKAEVEAFEKQYNALVYIVIRTPMWFGLCDSYLYVSDYKEEWEMDNDDIEHGYVMAYVLNHDAPECSEFGTICVKLASGAGLVRDEGMWRMAVER